MMLGFKDRFCARVESGDKRHSCRSGNRWKVGDRADCYQRPRQKGCRLMFRAWVTKVDSIRIDLHPTVRHQWKRSKKKGAKAFRELLIALLPHLFLKGENVVKVWIAGTALNNEEIREFFRLDGFTDDYPSPAIQMACFLYKSLPKRPFAGQVIYWNYRDRFQIKNGRRKAA